MSLESFKENFAASVAAAATTGAALASTLIALIICGINKHRTGSFALVSPKSTITNTLNAADTED